jgi:hypothetical protein
MMGLHPCKRLITDCIDEKHAGKSWPVDMHHEAHWPTIRPGAAHFSFDLVQSLEHDLVRYDAGVLGVPELVSPLDCSSYEISHLQTLGIE